MALHLGSRRKPYPWSAYIGGVPVMFKVDRDGKELYGKKSIGLENVAPQVWDYASATPFKEQTYAFRGLEMGIAETTQRDRGAPAKAREIVNIDWSLGYGIKGHYFHRITPASTGAVRDFTEMVDGGETKLFALCDRYVNAVNADDTTTLSKDLGAGVHGRQMVRFKDAGVSPVDGLYVGVDSGNFERYDGSVWTAGPFNIGNWEARREELWGKSATNAIRKVTADPMTSGNWAAAITIGDGSGDITWLRQVQNDLYAFKTDGIYSLDTEDVGGVSTPLDVDLYPAGYRDANNGVNATGWGGRLWVPFGNGLASVGRNRYGVVEYAPVSLGWTVDDEAEVRGRPVAFAGHNTWYGYVAIYNDKNGNSYLGKYLQRASQDGGGQDVFFCAIKKWAAKQVTSMKLWARAGENERLWVGFADGDIDWCWLPKNSPDPTSDPVCEFNTDDGWVRWPVHHMGFEAMNKLYRGFSAFGPKLSADNSVTVEYRTDLNSAFTALSDALTYTGERIDLGDDTTATYGKAIDVKTHLVNAATTATPIVEGVGLHEQLRPDEVLEYDMVVDCRLAASRGGTVTWRTPEQVKADVLAAVSQVGATACLLADEAAQELSFYDHGEALDGARVRSGLSWDLPLKAVQFRTSVELGTYERLEAWSYDELEAALTYAEMEVV